MKNKRLYLLAVLVVIGAFLALRKEKGDGGSAASWNPFSAPSSSVTAGATLSAPNSSSGNAAQESVTEASAPTPAFVTWFNGEAKNLDQPTNQKNKESELKQTAARLTTADVRFLENKTLDFKNPANERILAAYLLTLAPQSDAALSDMVQAPLAMAGEHPVHSPEETLAAQEKSIRRMAIDALIERARSNPALRNELSQTIAKISDPSLREYAEKSYRQLAE